MIIEKGCRRGRGGAHHRDIQGQDGSYDSTTIGERFHLAPPPTALARTASIAPIGFTRLVSRDAGPLRAKDVPVERAYALHLALEPTAVDLWVDGKHVATARPMPGEAFLFDLSSNPVSEFHAAFDVMRFYISQGSLDELGFDRGLRGSVSLDPQLGVQDGVMHGLAIALMGTVERPNERSALFVDHVALAFHAHLVAAYARRGRPAAAVQGGLAPWQLQRAIDFMRDHLDGDPTIANLAVQCGLSHSYFARAFRQSVGTTPHQWLIRYRVARARELLLASELGLAAIATVCGFVHQSHFNRVFVRCQGEAPGRWRRRHR